MFPGTVFLRAEKQRESGSTIQSDTLEVGSCPGEAVTLKLTGVVVDRPEPNKTPNEAKKNSQNVKHFSLEACK